MRGLLFALCCHHCCSWNSYVGKEFLENLGFTSYYFHILCCLSSWATCGSRTPLSEKDLTDGEKTSVASSRTKELSEGKLDEPDDDNGCLHGHNQSDVEQNENIHEGSCIK